MLYLISLLTPPALPHFPSHPGIRSHKFVQCCLMCVNPWVCVFLFTEMVLHYRFPPVFFPLSPTWCFLDLVVLFLHPPWLTYLACLIPLRAPPGGEFLWATHAGKVWQGHWYISAYHPWVLHQSEHPAEHRIPISHTLLTLGSSWLSHFCQPSGAEKGGVPLHS